ncbi:WXG100 family type VII secretion target [Streptomyces sp. NPDC020096]
MSGSSGGMVGADLDQLKKMVGDFITHREDLDRIFKALDTMSQNSQDFWKGPNAEKFRTEWASLRPHFGKVVDLVHQAHQATDAQWKGISAAVGAGGH